MEKINTLYLVDDDDMFQFLTTKIINQTHLVDQIKVFSNGQEAIDFLESNQHDADKLPEIILLDLSMPILDGWGFLDEFAKIKTNLDKKIVIYIVSSSIDPKDLDRAKTVSDVTDFIIKPVSKEKFTEIIKLL